MRDDKTNGEFDRFNKTMKKVLKMSKQELNKRLEAEKRSKPSASPGPAVSR
jgi:uncharacterized protein (UPF0335 family)